jgi:hypothetical protein
LKTVRWRVWCVDAVSDALPAARLLRIFSVSERGEASYA